MSGRVAKAGRIAQVAKDALENEQITRERVDAIEKWAVKFTRLTLKERLRWLLLGT
jgi:hypothetical protein